MRIFHNTRLCGALLTLLLCLGQGTWRAGASASSELEFETLTLGTRTYTNVTVTTKNKDYVFLLHSQGMLNVKVTELSDEEKTMLGYQVKAKPSTNSAKAWAKEALKKIETPQVQKLEKSLQASLNPDAKDSKPDLQALAGQTLSMPIVAAVLGLVLAFYLFGCYCCALICKKAGSDPGVMIWIPVVQMFPMLRAAQMSPLWFVATLLPVLNVIAHIVWCVRIAKARGKGIATGIFLILPVTNIFAFLYLAFSDGVAKKDQEDQDVLVLSAT